MIELKQAASIAVNFVKEVYDSEDMKDFVLEEVEMTDDEKFWLITIGFTRKKPITDEFDKFLSSTNERVYKTVKIEAETGKPRSMKIGNNK